MKEKPPIAPQIVIHIISETPKRNPQDPVAIREMESRATRHVLEQIGLSGDRLNAAHDAAMRASAVGQMILDLQMTSSAT